MSLFSRHACLPSAEATTNLAACLAPRLAPGDVLLLEGPIGAGKTHFARGLIQAILATPEDVPSPTFTLVQTYDTSAARCGTLISTASVIPTKSRNWAS